MLYPIAYCLLCLLVAFIGRDRKFGFWGYFFCSVLITPLGGIFLVIATDKQTLKARESAARES